MNNALQVLSEQPDAFAGLREEAYTATLVSCAERAGLFAASDKTAMQAGLYALLCELAARASKGKSSSLRIERAEELLEMAAAKSALIGGNARIRLHHRAAQRNV